ncbi:3-oxoacyl-ACP synthase [bacterium CG_4_10_14_0_2_um_filter_33_32]|nr:MAG: hypothetical protein AUJ93_02470 [bacterium CG2_30_33_46]PIY85255.1 MAG: 3-oxoacyl-ACP synthase [bacterium CG_4_10_14_0_8_um_filter_33_57]PIZ85340.1 MAG: 3-oxoacyl-ACP synthase [bacterium CG_4_10_14_0_2_um_filter_33_32]PJA72629.1 MAG: 3-oxoacyl-ACP synthase [bacterium CG_4_9_14_3_um_filter_33_26]
MYINKAVVILNVGILGIGVYLPDQIVNNSTIEQELKKNFGWIEKRTGIRKRRVIASNQQVSDLAALAAEAALKDANLDKADISLILVATSSPEMPWPSTACLVQDKLGITTGIPCFDIQAVCSGFSYGLDIACKYSKQDGNILFICAEAFTRITNPKDDGTYPLFGDGAGALIIGHVEQGYGILDSQLGADGEKHHLLRIPAGGSAILYGEKKLHFVHMDGREVFKIATDIPFRITQNILDKNSISVTDVKFFVPHQANQRIIDAYAKGLGFFGSNKVFSNIAEYGNTSSASIPIALHELNSHGLLEKGDIIVTVSFGAGFTWGANIIRWNLEKRGADKNDER